MTIGADEFLNKVSVVHATGILPKGNRSIAGNSLDIYDGYAPHYRMTHHNCCGGLVPDHLMGKTINFMGFTISERVNGGHSASPYIFIEPLKDLKGCVIGGTLNDLFTFGDRTYGPRATALIPESEGEQFKERNPDFPGELILYTPGAIAQRELVDQQLNRKGAWLIALSGDPDPEYPQFEECTNVVINGQSVDHRIFRSIFQDLKFHYGSHNYHRLEYLEQPFRYFLRAFLARQPDSKESIMEAPLPRHHIPILTALARYHLEKLPAELNHLGPSVFPQVLTWMADLKSWLNLYELEYSLHPQKKSIFLGDRATYVECCEMRHDPAALKRLVAHMQELKSSIFDELDQKQNKAGLAPLIPERMGLQEAQEICAFIQKEVPDWVGAPRVLAAYCLTHLFDQQLSSQQSREGVIHLLSAQVDEFKKRLPASPKRLAELYDYFRGRYFTFYHSINNTSGQCIFQPDDKKILKCTNMLPVKEALAVLLNLPHWSTLSEITLDEVLQHAPATKVLYGSQDKTSPEFADETIFDCGNFMKDYFLSQSRENFKQARALATKYVNFCRILGKAPLNSGDEVPLVYQLIKNGTFGSLDDIFGRLGVGEEYRETFQNDTAFWEIVPDEGKILPTITGELTFFDVYLDLRYKRNKKAH